MISTIIKIVKHLFFAILVVFALPQVTFSQNEKPHRHLKAELEATIIELNTMQSKIPEKEYADLISRYNLIVAGINGYYGDAAVKISNGSFLVRGDNVKKKYVYIAEGIASYEMEADLLLVEIRRTIDIANGKTPDTRLTAFWMEGMSVVLFVKLFYDFVKKANCVNAGIYYEETRWLTAKELLIGKRDDVSWSLLLGNDCADAIRKFKIKQK